MPVWLALVAASFTGARAVATPGQVAEAVGTTLARYPDTFINWEGGFTYGGAIVADRLLRGGGDVSHSHWGEVVGALLHDYMATPAAGTDRQPCDLSFPYGPSRSTRSCGYALNAGTEFPNSSSLTTVGDRLLLFPIAYLTRFLQSASHTESDLTVALAAAKLVLHYPHTLSDGVTFSRTGGCCDNIIATTDTEAAPYLWSDDQYMGLTLLARLAACDKCGLSASYRRGMIDRAVAAQQSYSHHLTDSRDGLRFHGAKVLSNGTTLQSCCKWGRANGWGILSHTELLNALEAFPTHPQKRSIQSSFSAFIDSALRVQDKASGRWRQVLDDTSTYLETSSTAMIVTALATGIHRGWLSNSTARWNALVTGWQGLSQQILANGTVLGISMGTPILPNASAYNERGTDFMQSCSGGVGAVLQAAQAVALMPLRS